MSFVRIQYIHKLFNCCIRRSDVIRSDDYDVITMRFSSSVKFVFLENSFSVKIGGSQFFAHNL